MSRGVELTAHDYASGIARALREDYAGDSMAKRVCEDTGAALGTVKKWLAEENGPGGEHLIKLMAASPAVRTFVDKVTRREDAAAALEVRMRRALAIMEGREDPPKVVELMPKLEAELERRPPAPSQAKREPPAPPTVARAAR